MASENKKINSAFSPAGISGVVDRLRPEGSPPFLPPGGHTPSLSRKAALAWGVLTLCIITLLWHDPYLMRRLDYMAQDSLSIRKAALAAQTDPDAARPRIALILIGERSLRAVGQWPWPRSHHARLLERLTQARTVAFDMVMPESTTPEDDSLFADAARRHGRALMALYLVPTAQEKSSGLTPVFPYPELSQACAGFGVVNSLPDPDGIVRDTRLLWQADGLNLPSLALAVAQMLTPHAPEFHPRPRGWLLRWKQPDAGTRIGPTDFPGDSPFPDSSLDPEKNARFAPVPPESLPSYEYVDVLNGLVPADAFTGTAVLVGMSGAGTTDLHRMAGGRFVPGIWLIAQTLSGIMSGKTLSPAPSPPVFAAALLLGMACASAGLHRSIRRGAGRVSLFLAAWTAVWAMLLWFSGCIMPLAAPLGAGLLLYGAAVSWRMSAFEREWSVRSLPLEEILLFPRRMSSQAAAETSFSDYLHMVWPKIAALCDLTLLAARADAASPAIARCLEAAARRFGESASHVSSAQDATQGLLVIPHYAAAAPRHRLLIPLPFPGRATFALAGWDRKLHLETLKSVAALVVSVATHYTAIEEQIKRQTMLFATIRALSGAIDAKDPVTAGHSERVAALARDLAIWLGLPEESVEDVFLAGILHDVGKIGVPDNVLNKAGILSDEEFRAMRSHPRKGSDILSPIALPEAVIHGVLEHHERLDGKGYPDGVTGAELSLTARILKIADVYDALVSTRQYKDPWPVSKACDLLHAQRDTEFDSRIVEVFLRHMAPQGWSPPGR